MAFGLLVSIRDGTPLSNPTPDTSLVRALQYYTITHLNISFVINKLCQIHACSHWLSLIGS